MVENQKKAAGAKPQQGVPARSLDMGLGSREHAFRCRTTVELRLVKTEDPAVAGNG